MESRIGKCARRRDHSRRRTGPAAQQWMKEVNPYALHNMLDKLLEAIQRGMWNTDDDTLEALRNAYLDAEGEIEAVTDDEG
jgi:cobaltochelatase CobN